MKKVLSYIKLLGIFSLTEIFIIFICSLINLIFKTSNITTIILFITNLVIYLLLAFQKGKTTQKKGAISGLITGLALMIFSFLIYIIFYNFSFDINKVIYYLSLVLSSIIGGIMGKNKSKTNQE